MSFKKKHQFHPESVSEKELVLSLRHGDIQAFKILYDRYGAKVYNFLHQMLFDKARAEDFTQDVFLKLWEKRAFLDSERGIASYIFTIAKHLVYKHTEKMVMYNNYIEASPDDKEVDNSTQNSIDAAFMTLYLQGLISQLPPSRREIFMLSRINGLSNQEIADKLGLSVRTVDTQIYRALNFIKKNRVDKGN